LSSIKKFIIVIRHAEKYLYEDSGKNLSALITEAGIKNSNRLGKQIKKLFNRIALIKSSPIERCVQTSEAIIQDHSNPPVILISKNLGDPEIFVLNDKKALDSFIKLGVKDVIEKMLEGVVLPD